MAAATTPAVPEPTPKTPSAPAVPFDFSKPPTIEGFDPLPRTKDETLKEKFMRKTKENPFVPIGCLGTAGALMYGLRAFHQGKTRKSQLLMRGRIFAQGFTVVAIIFGVFTTAMKPKQWRRGQGNHHTSASLLSTRSQLELDWIFPLKDGMVCVYTSHCSDPYTKANGIYCLMNGLLMAEYTALYMSTLRLSAVEENWAKILMKCECFLAHRPCEGFNLKRKKKSCLHCQWKSSHTTVSSDKNVLF